MKERIISLDVMRGISLMGILFMNALGVHYFTVFDTPFEYYHDAWSEFLYKMNLLFIQNSFYPIFAFLFGVGLSIMHTNIISRGMSSTAILFRRMLAMLVFGLLHGYLIYNGDILHTYAVMGCIAIPFLWFKRRSAFIFATCLWMLNLLMYLTSFNEIAKKVIPFHRNPATDDILSSGNIFSIIQWNLEEFNNVNTLLSPGNFLAAILTVLPFILFGISVHRYEWFAKMRSHSKRVIITAICCFIIGIYIKTHSFEVIGSALAPQALFVGGSLVAISYFLFVTLLCNKQQTLKFIYPMQAVGKLGFTVYITQNVILFLLFYVFKMYNTLSIGNVYIVVLIIAVIQIICANIYLKYFKMGPLEWLWRKITYLKEI